MPHAFLHRHVLGVDTVNAGEGLVLLDLPVNEPIVFPVAGAPVIGEHLVGRAAVAPLDFVPFRVGYRLRPKTVNPVVNHAVPVVHRHPHMAGDDLLGGLSLVARLAGPHLVEGEDVLVGPHEIAPLAQGANTYIAVAVVGEINFHGRRAADYKVGVDADAGAGRFGGDGAVQDGSVGGIYAPLQRLQPVAHLPVFGYVAVGFRHLGPLEIRRRWRLAARLAQVGPDYAALLQGGVGGDAHLGVKVAVRGFVHHIQAVAVHVELPAVVHAAEAALLVATQE